MPKSPRTFATVLTKLIHDASPNKQLELQKRGVKRKLEDTYVVKSLKKTILEMKTNMTEQKRRSYNTIAYACLRTSQYGNCHRTASALGILVLVAQLERKQEN